MIIPPSLLNSISSRMLVAPYHTIPVFGIVSTELQGQGPPSLDMELNRAQLLARDDAALNKFWIDHNIPKGIQIECPRPNEDVNLVEGHRNCTLVHIWEIHKVGLRFPISPLLKEMKLPFSVEDLMHIYIVVRPRKEPSTPFFGRIPKPTRLGEGEEAQANEATEHEGEAAVEEVRKVAAEAVEPVTEVGEAEAQDPLNKP
ncbi:hypothetical protein Acr_07g0012220 [Actinidia rufa]|uniref:Uncharacterized protein n=1 Tax=Actinidia rufa TaxID=165716 RepID=A0A7J0EXV2_9ERIC|nr:hypothetical protein Acr_07g0012220 [Actinidia rufa]